MPIDDAKAVVRRYFDDYHTGRRLDLLDELVAEELRGPTAGAQQTVERAFPDYVLTVGSQVAEQAVVATVWSGRGTHEGPWQSPLGVVEPTGRSIEWTATTTLAVREGKIAEVLGTHWDHLGILQQMGALDALGGPVEPRPGA